MLIVYASLREREINFWAWRKHIFETPALTDIDYFLFILVEDEKMPKIIEKYNLKPMS